jgi:hypothetical protein
VTHPVELDNLYPRQRSYEERIGEPQDTMIQLLTSENASNQSTVTDVQVAAPVQRLLAKQCKRILKRLHTRKPKG